MNLTPPRAWVLALFLMASSTVFGQPIITDFSPKVGTPGDVITLNGAGFTLSGIIVQFWNGMTVNSGFITSDSLMTVTVPAGVSTGPIGILQQGGTPQYSGSDFTAIGPGPYITDFSPLYGKVNDLVVINGVHFFGIVSTSVSFNGAIATDASANAAGTQINVHVPNGATNGPISVAAFYGTSNSPNSFTVIGPGPFITDFSPTVGTPGTRVFIDGQLFTGATNATFNGTPGLNFAVRSDTLIQVDAPPNVSSGPIAVNSPLGSWTTVSNFFVPPTISNFSPTGGRPGTNVMISGANFLGTTNVSFGGVATPSYTVLSNTVLSATVPAGATTGQIRVTTPAGSAFSGTNFTVQPVLSGFSPTFGTPGTSVTVTGANLNVGTPVVRFNGVAAAAPTGVKFGQLTAVVPAGATTGPISVTTSDGSYTNASTFYLPASISSFSPTNAAPGTWITIRGQNFIGATTVNFNGTAAPSSVVTNSTTAGAAVPDGVITGPVSITTPAGTASSTGLFYGAPVITNFTPTHGLPGSTVTINGLNFLGATALSFGGLNSSFSVTNNGKITATVPNGAQTGPITVVAPAGTNTSAESFALDYTSDLTISVTGTPNPVTIGSNLLYTVTIFNNGPFAARNVSVTNTLPATVVVQSVVTPAGWTLVTNGNTIIGGVSNLVNSGLAALLISVVPQSMGNIVDTASVGSDFPDPSPIDNNSTVTTTVEPPALLSIALLDNQVKVAWPLALTNYVLESTDFLATNNFWSNVIATSIISGNLEYITETNNGSAKFYRLRK
jgi:uncharacterized repeat protein (TIGR01451 family)